MRFKTYRDEKPRTTNGFGFARFGMADNRAFERFAAEEPVYGDGGDYSDVFAFVKYLLQPCFTGQEGKILYYRDAFAYVGKENGFL